MKNFLKLLAFFACSALVFVACETDETVDDYTVEVTQISTYKVLPGSEKIQVTWTAPNDENITGAKIVWSGATKGEHSIGEDDGFAINTTQEYIIPNLTDGGTYSVTIYSLVGGYIGTGSATESGVKVYGPKTYAEADQPAVVGSVTMSGDDALVKWDNINLEHGAYGVDVEYKMADGVWNSVVTEFTSATDQQTTLTSPKAGEYFTYKALYRPSAESSDFDKNPATEGYDSAEVLVESQVLIENAALTAATPVLESALGGNESLEVKWSGITADVESAILTLYVYDKDSDSYLVDTSFGTEGSAKYAKAALGVETVTDENTQETRDVATLTIDNLTEGKNYKVGIQNVITGEIETSEVVTGNIFVYGEDLYANNPKIATPSQDVLVAPSMVYDVYSNIVTITWDMTGVVISDIDKILVSYTDKFGKVHNDYDGSTETTDDDVAEAQVISVDGVHTSLLTNDELGFSSNAKISYKAYFRPTGSIDGSYFIGNEVAKYDDSSQSDYIKVPYPALQAPENLVLKAGYSVGSESPYLRVLWSEIGLAAYENGIEFEIYYATEDQAGLNNFSTKTISVANGSTDITELTVGEPGMEQKFSYVDFDDEDIADIASDMTYVAYVVAKSTNSADSAPSERYTAKTYSPATYDATAEALGNSDGAVAQYPVGDGADATITWDWLLASTDATAVEVVSYVKRADGSYGSVAKTSKLDAATITLTAPRGATKVTYKAYFQPELGIDEVAVEKTLTLPGIEIVEPTLWLTTDLQQNIDIHWGVKSVANLTGMKIYWREQTIENEKAYTSIDIKGSDFKVGEFSRTLTVADNSIEVDKSYEVYITVADIDNNTDRPVEIATVEEPMIVKTYNAESYKDLDEAVTPTHTAATTGEARVFMWDWSKNEDVRGVVVNYTDASGNPATAGEEDYEGELPEMISIPLNQISMTDLTYTYTLYYYPTGGETPVSGTESGSLDYPTQAPPVPQLVSVVSTFDDTDKPMVKVNFTISDYNRGLIEDGVVNIFCIETGEVAGDDTEPVASFELVGGQTAYEAEVTSGIFAGRSYTVYVGITATSGYSDLTQVSTKSVEGVNVYNTASYYKYIPSVVATADYTNKVTLKWTDDAASAELKGVTLTYGDFTSSEITSADLNSKLSTVNYDSAIDNFIYVSRFEIAPSEDEMLTYEKTELFVESQPTLIAAEYYDIITLEGMYNIYTAKGLAAFADIVNGTSTHNDAVTGGDATFSWSENSAAPATVIATIDLADLGETTNWVPIGNNASSKTYTGTFDGGNYAISNLYMNGVAGMAGLFGQTTNATIQNVNLVDVNLSNPVDGFGAVVGNAITSTITYCKVSGEIDGGGKQWIGGIVGKMTGANGKTEDIPALANISYCENWANIKSTSRYLGGIVGYTETYYADIEYCKNYGNITSTGNNGSCGGVIGAIGNTGSYVRYCENHGDVTVENADNIGGIVGYANFYGPLSEAIGCVNTGTISAKGSVGGILGYALPRDAAFAVTDCTNKGIVKGSGNYVGGVVGQAGSSGSGTIGSANNTYGVYTNLSNEGDVSGAAYVGGILGFTSVGSGSQPITISGTSETERAKNTGSVTGTGDFVGGIIGSLVNTLSYYDNYGTVTGVGENVNGLVGNYEAMTDKITDCNDYTFDSSSRDIALVGDTYQIYTAKGLKAFADLVDGKTNSASASTWDAAAKNTISFTQTAIATANAKLMAEIDLTTIGSSNNWTPIATPYEGTFNGAGQTIKGLNISSTSSDIALFATLATGTIQNVTLDNVSITTSGDNVAALVATMSGEGTIAQCYVTGETSAISGANNVGGIVGTQSAGTISNVANEATVTATGDNVGGVVGYVAETATIFSASNSADITTQGTNVGGIIGYNAGSATGNISPISTNTGVVTGADNVGGIVGNNEGSIAYFENQSEIIATGETSTNVDGVVGTGTGRVENCNSTYITVPEDVDIVFKDGEYLIYTAKGLKAFGDIVNAQFTTLDDLSSVGIMAYDANSDANGKLMENIDLAELGETTNWTPIGLAKSTALATYDDGVEVAYTGDFDGNNKLIKNLFINIKNTTNGYNQALFGYVSGSSIKDLTLNNVNITGNSDNRHTAAVVGHAVEGAVISNCKVTGVSSKITGVATNTGGIVGYAADSKVENCENSAKIESSVNVVGGIVGETKNASVIGCTNNGIIEASKGYAGGIVGQTGGGYVNIENCHNTANIEAGGNGVLSNVGGIVGYYYANGSNANSATDSSSSYIKGCTNSGNVTATQASVGGIVGRYFENEGTSYIDGCSNSGAIVSGAGVGGVVGVIAKTTEGATKTIYNSNNTGSVTATGTMLMEIDSENVTGSFVGGIAGFINANAVVSGESATSRGSNSGEVSGTTAPVGGVAGYNAGTLKNYNNYGLVTVAGVADNGTDNSGIIGDGNKGTDCKDYYFDASNYDLVFIEGAYQIYTAKGMVAFADLVNGKGNSVSAATYVFDTATEITFGTATPKADGKLMASVDLSDYEWTVDTYTMTGYAGTFDGGNGLSELNTTESGIEITGFNGTTGLFASTADGAVIKNLTLNIEELTLSVTGGALITTDAIGLISYCRIHGDITSTVESVSAVAGGANGLTIEYTNNHANITGTGKKHQAGFIVSTKGALTVNYCNNYGNITGGSGAGFSGFVMTSHTFTGCNNYGNIIVTGDEAAGIINSTRTGVFVECNNYGIISANGSTGVGGIVGNADATSATITACNNYGTINGGGDSIGGIIGRSRGGTTKVDGAYSTSGITESYNYGAVNSTNAEATLVGGIVGNLATNITVSNYVNKGAVTLGGTLVTTGSGAITGGTNINATAGIGGSASEGTADASCRDDFAGLPATLKEFTVASGTEQVSIVVGWTYSGDIANVAGVKIFYGTVASGIYLSKVVLGGVEALTSGTHTLTESVDGLTENTQYSVYVEACNADGLTIGGVTAENVTTMKELPSADDVENPDIVVRGVTYEIYTPAGLVAFANIVNGTLETMDGLNTNIAEEPTLWDSPSATALVAENIDMKGVVWTPIGDYNTSTDNVFSGKFDGGSKNISNLTINTPNIYQGLFGALSSATVSNVNLVDVDIEVNTDESSSHVAAVAGYSEGNTTIKSVTTTGTVYGEKSRVAGIVATAVGTLTITDCTNGATVESGANSAANSVHQSAGIVGHISGAATITGTTNNGALTANNGGYNGGIVGQVDSSSSVILEDCTNNGNLWGAEHSNNSNLAGMVGSFRVTGTTALSRVTDCKNTGSITGTGHTVGGIVGIIRNGSGNDNFVIEGCTNSGDVSGENYTAGILGYADANYAKVVSSSNSGSISGLTYVGGIYGGRDAETDGITHIITGESTSNRSTNSGRVSGTASVGGIVGHMPTVETSTLSFYNNNGIVMVDGEQVNGTKVNGIVGNYASVSSYITYCTDNISIQTKAPALASVEVTEDAEVVGFTVSWSYGSTTAGITGVRIFFGVNGEYESVDVSGSSSTSRTLTAEDGLAEGITYDIYAATYNSVQIVTEADIVGGSSENLAKATTITYDLGYNAEDNVYEIFTATGMFAYADLVAGAENTKSAKITGFTWPTEDVDAGGDIVSTTKVPASTPTINGRVMKSIALEEDWVAIANFGGEFDGGNGLSEENGVETGITISGVAGVQGLFANTAGAYVHNVTLEDVAIVSTDSNVGALIGSAVSTDIMWCHVISGSVAAQSNVGGIAGEIDENTEINNAVNGALIVATEAPAGGIVGTNNGVIANSTNESKVSIADGEHSNDNGIAGAGEGTTDGCIDDYAADIEFKDDAYYIYTANGLMAFADLVNGEENNSNARTVGINAANDNEFGTAHSGIDGVVAATIDLTGKTWLPIEDFVGTFDGGSTNEDIAGIEIQNLTGAQGLFGTTSSSGGAVIKNVTLTDVAISGDEAERIGAIAGAAISANIENVSVSGSVSGASTVGGIVGGAYGGNPLGFTTISNATNSASVTATEAPAGALAGENNEGCTITNSTNTGAVTVAGVLQNGQSDSMLVGVNDGTVDDDSSDNYTSGKAIAAAAVSGVTAYPTFESATPQIKVSYTFGESVAKVDEVIIRYKAVDGDGNWTSDVITDNIIPGTTVTRTLEVDADTDYEIYVVTVNVDDAETASNATESAPLEVTSFNANSYDASVPAVISAMKVANESAGYDVVVNWDEETFVTDDLVKVTVSYGNGEAIELTYADIVAAEYKSTFAYETDVNTLTYTATFKPVEYMASGDPEGDDYVAENEKVPSVTVTSDAVDIALADIVFDDETDTFKIYSAKGLMAFSALTNGVVKPEGVTTEGENFPEFSGDKVNNVSAVVMNTIDLTGETWSPISANAVTFDGGNGGAEPTDVVIKGLAGDNGLFSSATNSSAISNVTLVAPVINNDDEMSASVGAIAGTLDTSSIAYCVVDGGSVTATDDGEYAYAGALVGYNNAGTISNSSSSCSVTIAGKIYNGGTDSWLVGNGTAADDTCADNYTEGTAASLTDAVVITAVPYCNESDSDSDTGIKVSYNKLNSDANVVSATLFYKEVDAETYSTQTLTIGADNFSLQCYADKTYTFYVETYNYVGIATKSNEVEATSYGPNSYDDEVTPVITATYNAEKAINLEWIAPDLSESLQEIKVTYGETEETIDAETLATGSYTMDVTYDSATATSVSYICYYAPMESSKDYIAGTPASAIVGAPEIDIRINGKGVHQIATAKGLKAFADIVNGEATNTTGAIIVDEDGATVAWAGTANLSANAKITDNIDMAELGKVDWTPIGSSANSYVGTFDGKSDEGLTISNLYAASASQYFGLFGHASTGAVLENIKLVDVDITAAATHVAALIGYVKGDYLGGAAGYENYTSGAVSINNCEVSGTMVGGKNNTAAIIGFANNRALIENTKSDVDITTATGGAFIGGMGANTPIWIENCENHGDITSTGNSIGGFGGYWDWNGGSQMIDCTNYGTITSGGTEAAGFLGSIGGRGGVLLRCNNMGTIIATGEKAGGIAGQNAGATITACSNTGSVTATNYAGGIIGNNTAVKTHNGADGADITSSFNSGTISSAGANVGGIVGSSVDKSGAVVSSATISNYNNYGTVLPSGATEHVTANAIVGGEGTTVDASCEDKFGEPAPSLGDDSNNAGNAGGGIVDLEDGDDFTNK